jgi:hypothetical protein
MRILSRINIFQKKIFRTIRVNSFDVVNVLQFSFNIFFPVLSNV